MIRFTILFILINLSFIGFSQQWPVEIVRSNLDGAWIRPGDFDNDNDADLLIQNGDTLFWYENLQPGWAEHLIDTQFLNSSTAWVEVFDLDQDGDLDVLQFPFFNPGTIAWNENSMNGMNWEKHIISTTVNQPSNMPGAYGDLDGDNDIDFAVPSWGDGTILWFENVTGDTTWQEHQVANIGSNVIWTTFADMDGDNDLDIVGARYFSGDIIWYENQLPNTDWTAHPIATLPGTAIGIGMDMDEDGDQDIVTHSNISNQLIWYENPSWAGHTITTGIIGLFLGPVGDIDQDGDPDVVFGGQHSFGWCENLGNSTSWKRTILDSIHNQFPSPVDLADINGDNFPDMTAYTLDIFGNGLGDARWYANPLVIPVELTSFTAISQYGKVILNWSTATEINNLGFEIERIITSNETNGEWILVGFREGYGTTTEPRDYSFVDDIGGLIGNSLAYRLKQLDFDGSYEYSDEVMVEVEILLPSEFTLHQNYPNPFNPVTTISYSLPLNSQVELVVYNTLGEEVIQLVNGEKEAGQHSVEFDAASLPSGVYFYKIQAGSFDAYKKKVLMKSTPHNN